MPHAPPGNRAQWAAFAAISVLRLLFLWHLFSGAAEGFYFYSYDYLQRLQQSRWWLQNPSLYLDQIWLPLNFYLNGLLLRLFPDRRSAPVIFHLIVSGGLLTWIYLLSRRLFQRETGIGFLAVSWVFLNPILIKLGLSGGNSEIEFQFYLLGAFYFWIRHEEAPSIRSLWAAAILFALAGGTRHEAWGFMLYPSWLWLSRCWRSGRDRLPIAAALTVMWLIPLAWCANHMRLDMFPLLPPNQILENFRLGVPVGSGGRWPLWPHALTIYPAALWETGPVHLCVALLGAAESLRRVPACRLLLGSLLGGLVLMVLGIPLSLFLPLPLERVVLIFHLALAPFWGHALWSVVDRIQKTHPFRPPWLRRTAVIILSLALLAYQAGLAKDAARSLTTAWQPGPRDCLAVSRAMMRMGRIPKTAPRILFETWIQSNQKNHPHLCGLMLRYASADALFDRDITSQFWIWAPDGSGRMAIAHKPSLLDGPDSWFKNQCSIREFVAVVHTPKASRKVAPLMSHAASVGDYSVFVCPAEYIPAVKDALGLSE